MKADITWIDGARFVGESGSGHAVVMDGATEAGGRNTGPRPMEMLLLGMGGCTAYDVILILKRGREPVEDCRVSIEAERATSDPKVFTRIHARFHVSGRGLSRAKVERAVALSAEKYCSASIMLGATATLTHEIILHDPDAPDAPATEASE